MAKKSDSEHSPRFGLHASEKRIRMAKGISNTQWRKTQTV